MDSFDPIIEYFKSNNLLRLPDTRPETKTELVRTEEDKMDWKKFDWITFNVWFSL